MATLFHVSGWAELADATIGTEFVLRPGSQCAEGVGVYFSEGAPRISAAEGAHMAPSAMICIEASDTAGWWQSKGAKAKKFGKPRTWHSDTKHILCTVQNISESAGAPRLDCSWTFEMGE